uniref:Protein kinase domain-containing protein n=1 Tax=Plectus sambesii TaxID=2011161 RepID=A0A914WZV5_9BILA
MTTNTSDDEKAVDSAYGTQLGVENMVKFRQRASSLPFLNVPTIKVGGRTLSEVPAPSPRRASRRHGLSTGDVGDDGSVADDDADSNHARHIQRRNRHRHINQSHSFGASSAVKYYKGRGSLKQAGSKPKGSKSVNWDSNVTSPNEEGSEDDAGGMKMRVVGRKKKPHSAIRRKEQQAQMERDREYEMEVTRQKVPGTRYRSLRLLPQESQDDDGISSGSGRNTPGLVPIPKSDGERIKEQRKKYHETFQAVIKLNTETATKRTSEPELKMGGKRGSRVLISGSAVGDKHELGDVLWLHLQTYLSGRSMRTKQQINRATQAHDSFVLQMRMEQKCVLGDIRNYTCSQGALPTSSSADDPPRGSSTPIESDAPSVPFRLGATYADYDALKAFQSKITLSTSSEGMQETYSEKFLARQRNALLEVGELLRRYERFERLYPTSRTMRSLLGAELDAVVRDRISVLYVWYNITKDLCRKIKEVGHMLGMDKDWGHTTDSTLSPDVLNTSFHWPNVDYDSPVMSESEDDDEEDANSASDEEGNGAEESNATLNVPLEDASADVTPCTTEVNLCDQSDTAIVSCVEMYFKFVEKSLRLRGMRRVLLRLFDMCGKSLGKACAALERPPNSYAEAAGAPRIPSGSSRRSMPLTPDDYRWRWLLSHDSDLSCLLFDHNGASALRKSSSASNDSTLAKLPPLMCVKDGQGEISKYGVFHGEFDEMHLPSFYPSFLFLVRVPLDLVHEWLKLRITSKVNRDPDPLTLETLIQDAHDCLQAAVDVKQLYQNLIQATTVDETLLEKLLMDDLQEFENDLCSMFKNYLDYVRMWGETQANFDRTSAEWSQGLMQRLEDEWKLAKKIAINVLSGESDAAQRFCTLSKTMFKRMVEDYLKQKYDMVTDNLSELDDDMDAEMMEGGMLEEHRPSIDEESYVMSRKNSPIFVACRQFKSLVGEIRERSLRALAFAKLLGTDLEISAKFELHQPLSKLMEQLYRTGHVLVTTPHSITSFMMFCEESVSENEEHLQLLLNVTCGRDDHEVPKHLAGKPGYLLLVKCDDEMGAAKDVWPGKRIKITPDADTDMSLHYMHVDALYLVVVNSKSLSSMRSVMRRYVDDQLVTVVDEQCSCHEIIAFNMRQLKDCAMDLRDLIAEKIINMSEDLMEERSIDALDDNERQSLRATLVQAYNFAFEYHRELGRLISAQLRPTLAVKMVEFVKQWRDFLLATCERGHSVIPRWAFQGLHFLLLAAEPLYTVTLSEGQFKELESAISTCVAHVIGDKQTVRSKEETDLVNAFATLIYVEKPGIMAKSQTEPAEIGSSLTTGDGTLARPVSDPGSLLDFDVDQPTEQLVNPKKRVRKAIREQEKARKKLLYEERRIGRCVARDTVQPSSFFTSGKRAPFKWQRLEKKIGSGKFGTVYVVMNLQSGELLAMKQLKIDRNHRAMKSLVDEVENLERLKHPNLVRYYGVEVHREELLIFMEYCTEGTLEKVCREGLDMILVRKYTHFLLKGVYYMHQHGIVHRDIKPANIFIGSKDMVKLGDFGSSVRLNQAVTVHGELTEFVGTPAYMAPEVQTSGKSTDSDLILGYGRAADIWSIGCVVLEMATGKMPWHEFDWLQIVFRVGSGQSPTIPPALRNTSCSDFLSHCFNHRPSERWSADQLSEHEFANVNVGVRMDSISDSH